MVAISKKITPKSATQMKVIKGKNLCSAEPIIKGFKISVNDIFKK